MGWRGVQEEGNNKRFRGPREKDGEVEIYGRVRGIQIARRKGRGRGGLWESQVREKLWVSQRVIDRWEKKELFESQMLGKRENVRDLKRYRQPGEKIGELWQFQRDI